MIIQFTTGEKERERERVSEYERGSACKVFAKRQFIVANKKKRSDAYCNGFGNTARRAFSKKNKQRLMSFFFCASRQHCSLYLFGAYVNNLLNCLLLLQTIMCVLWFHPQSCKNWKEGETRFSLLSAIQQNLRLVYTRVYRIQIFWEKRDAFVRRRRNNLCFCFF